MMGIRVSTENGARLSLLTASLRAWPIYLPSVPPWPAAASARWSR